MLGHKAHSMVASCNIQEASSPFTEELRYNLQDPGVAEIIKEDTDEEARKSNNDSKKIQKPPERFIHSILCVPSNNILYTDFWINSNFRYFPHNNPLIATIVYNISLQITDMSLHEIFFLF